MWRWNLSLKEPLDILMVFITAGADVYATNDVGETPSMIACDYGREEEWTEALTLCGYDPEEVLAQSDPDLYDCTRPRQKSRLSFEEYCQKRKEKNQFEEVETDDDNIDSDSAEESDEDADSGEDEDIDEDDGSEYDENTDKADDDSEVEGRGAEFDYGTIEGIVENTECGYENAEIPRRTEYTERSTHFDQEDTSNNQGDYIIGEINHQAEEPRDREEKGLDRIDLGVSGLLTDDMDIVESFFDFDMYQDAREINF